LGVDPWKRNRRRESTLTSMVNGRQNPKMLGTLLQLGEFRENREFGIGVFPDGIVLHKAAMIENLLELCGCFHTRAGAAAGGRAGAGASGRLLPSGVAVGLQLSQTQHAGSAGLCHRTQFAERGLATAINEQSEIHDHPGVAPGRSSSDR
jgi:hypothetical protein